MFFMIISIGGSSFMIASGSKSGFLFFILIFSLLKNRVSGSLSTICSICPGLEGGII